MPKLTVLEQGFLEPNGPWSSLSHTLKDMLRMVPFSGYVFSCVNTEQVIIPIFEKFENTSFGVESVSMLVPNEAL